MTLSQLLTVESDSRNTHHRHPRAKASPLSLEERALARVSKDESARLVAVDPSRLTLDEELAWQVYLPSTASAALTMLMVGFFPQ